jgi:hypothetical protein
MNIEEAVLEGEQLLATTPETKSSPKSKTPFERRRLNDAQGLIDDLLAQTARQAKAIHKRGLEIDKLTKETVKLTKEIEKIKKSGDI